MLTLGLQLIEGGVGNFLLQYNVLSYVAVNILFYVQHHRMYVLNLSLALLSLVEQVSYETSSSEILYSHTVSGKSLKFFFRETSGLFTCRCLHAFMQGTSPFKYLSISLLCYLFFSVSNSSSPRRAFLAASY